MLFKTTTLSKMALGYPHVRLLTRSMRPTDQKVSGLNPDGVTDNQQVRSLRRPFFFQVIPTVIPKLDQLVPSWVKVILLR